MREWLGPELIRQDGGWILLRSKDYVVVECSFCKSVLGCRDVLSILNMIAVQMKSWRLRRSSPYLSAY